MTEDLGILKIRSASLPKDLASPPAQMSFSSLMAIEACPRRWALLHSAYPELWDRRGYPPSSNIATLQGNIAHRALQKIISAFVHAGCKSPKNLEAIQILRSMGGFTEIIDGIFTELHEKERGNPRSGPSCSYMVLHKEQILATIREEVRRLLSQQVLFCTKNNSQPTSHKHVSFPLHHGSFTEVDVKNPSINWTGAIDLLVLGDDTIEIIDFKTGKETPKHAEQVRVYSALWARDTEKNPKHQLATRLTLCYPNHKVEIPPLSEQGIKELENELIARTNAAKNLLSIIPAKASPSQENCQFCPVKQICDAYWNSDVLTQITKELPAQSESIDFEAEITSQHGPQSWEAKVVTSGHWMAGTPLLIRTNVPIQPIHPANIYRFLRGNKIIDPQALEIAVVTIHRFSEIFLRP